MDSAAEAGVHELAQFGPEWLFAGFVVVAGIVLLIALVPVLRDYINKRMEIAENESKERIDLDKRREERKEAEEKSREQRDRERSEMEGRWASQNERSITSQERTTVVLNAINSQLEVMNAQLMDSKANSKSIGEMLANMDHKVEDIHRELTK